MEVNVPMLKKTIVNKNTTLDLAIRQFTRSVFHALEKGDEKLLIFPQKIEQNEL